MGHAILYPPYPLTIWAAMKSIKLSSTNGLGRCRREAGELWQGRFFDHALRTVKDYTDTVEYIHQNPVRRGLVTRPEEWTWSSYHEYAGVSAVEQEKRCGLAMDRVRLPADEGARIWEAKAADPGAGFALPLLLPTASPPDPLTPSPSPPWGRGEN